MKKTSTIVPLRRSPGGFPDRLTVALSEPHDPRLVELVRLLARQAADDYFDAAAAKGMGAKAVR